MARRFFYVCAGLLCLAAAYHLGATNAESQAPGNPVVAITDDDCVVTANGDYYVSSDMGWTWLRRGNVFSSGPTQTQPDTWGGVKERFSR